MLASELIARIKSLMDTYGDMPVYPETIVTMQCKEGSSPVLTIEPSLAYRLQAYHDRLLKDVGRIVHREGHKAAMADVALLAEAIRVLRTKGN